jgi:hypothetical protein
VNKKRKQTNYSNESGKDWWQDIYYS